MIENNPLAEEVFREDIERIIKRGERTICVNPKCFDECCQGDCEEDTEDCPNEECRCRKDKKEQ